MEINWERADVLMYGQTDSHEAYMGLWEARVWHFWSLKVSLESRGDENRIGKSSVWTCFYFITYITVFTAHLKCCIVLTCFSVR
jgi:hypothetical protein